VNVALIIPHNLKCGKVLNFIFEPSYYVCTTYVCGFAAMAYFAMLSGQGWTAIAGCRQFFYARSVYESFRAFVCAWTHVLCFVSVMPTGSSHSRC
jgi:bacteriorhodopsin